MEYEKEPKKCEKMKRKLEEVKATNLKKRGLLFW